MKLVILSTRDISGGAARATYRLHRGLRSIGVESCMMVQFKTSDDQTVVVPQSRLYKILSQLRPGLDALFLKLYTKRQSTNYSVQWLPGTIRKRIAQFKPDIVNLHWICKGYLRVETIGKLNAPLVWSLHDMWPFTGGCHYDQGCGRYAYACGACPQLHSFKDRDISRWIWRRKAKAWQSIDLTIVALSQWLANCARKSSLFRGLRIEVIPNSLDTDRFKPVDKRMAREVLNLPQDKQLILFGAMRAASNPRKAQAPLPDIGPRIEIAPPGRVVSKLLTRILPSSRLRDLIDQRAMNPFPYLILRGLVLSGGIGAWRSMVDVLRRCDAVYYVGAANLNDFARYSCVLPKCALVEQAHALNIPSIISSQTVGPLELSWTRRLVKRAVDLSTFFSLRDGGISKALLTGIGVNQDRLVSVGDEAFSLPAASKGKTERYLIEQGIDPKRSFALVHFRATDYTQSTNKYYAKLAQALDQVQVGTRILFVPMSYWQHSGRDERCGQAIQALMAHPDKMQVLSPTRDVHVIRCLVDMSSWVMALSYHLQVFALAAACPMVIIFSGSYYQVKAKGMQMLVGSDVPVVNLDQITAAELAAVIQRLEKERSFYESVLEPVRSAVAQVNHAPIEALARALTPERPLI